MSKTVSESHRNLNTLLSSKGLEKETSNLDFKSHISKKKNKITSLKMKLVELMQIILMIKRNLKL